MMLRLAYATGSWLALRSSLRLVWERRAGGLVRTYTYRGFVGFVSHAGARAKVAATVSEPSEKYPFKLKIPHISISISKATTRAPPHSVNVNTTETRHCVSRSASRNARRFGVLTRDGPRLG
jgi:hypothetical protein